MNRFIACFFWITLPIVAAFLFAPMAYAVEASTVHSIGVPLVSESNTLAALGQISGALLLVLLAIWGCAWFVRRILVQGGFGGQNYAKIVTAISLGSRERVVIVEIQAQWLVLGVSQGGVNLLHILPKPESQPPTSIEMQTFAQRFKAVIGSQNLPKNQEDDAVDR